MFLLSTRSWSGKLKFTVLTNFSCQLVLLSERMVSYKYDALIRLLTCACILFGLISGIESGSAI